MGKRNQARKKAQAKKSQAKKSGGGGGGAKRSGPAKSSGGGGGNRQRSGPARTSSNNSANRAGPRTANQPRNRGNRQEAGGRSTASTKAKLEQARANRKAKRDESHRSQGEISGVSDFDLSKRGKKTVEKGELNYLRKQGLGREEISEYARNSGLRLRRGAKNKLDRWDARAKAKEKAEAVVNDPINTEQPITPETIPTPPPASPNAGVNQEPPSVPVYKPITVSPSEELLNPPSTTTPNIGVPGTVNENDVEQSQDQTVSQDNDINSNVTGDNNNVNINQDNSVRQYGGINKSFIYNGSSNGNNYMDTPVSAGTIGGYFHDEDSPGRSASFMDRYATMNRDYQKQFQNTNFAAQAITKAAQNKAVDVGALDQRVDERAKANRARSSSMAGDIFGDMFNYQPEEFKSAKGDEDDE